MESPANATDCLLNPTTPKAGGIAPKLAPSHKVVLAALAAESPLNIGGRALTARFPHISRSTLYRAIARLTSLGLIAKARRYDRASAAVKVTAAITEIGKLITDSNYSKCHFDTFETEACEYGGSTGGIKLNKQLGTDYDYSKCQNDTFESVIFCHYGKVWPPEKSSFLFRNMTLLKKPNLPFGQISQKSARPVRLIDGQKHESPPPICLEAIREARNMPYFGLKRTEEYQSIGVRAKALSGASSGFVKTATKRKNPMRNDTKATGEKYAEFLKAARRLDGLKKTGKKKRPGFDEAGWITWAERKTATGDFSLAALADLAHDCADYCADLGEGIKSPKGRLNTWLRNELRYGKTNTGAAPKQAPVVDNETKSSRGKYATNKRRRQGGYTIADADCWGTEPSRNSDSSGAGTREAEWDAFAEGVKGL